MPCTLYMVLVIVLSFVLLIVFDVPSKTALVVAVWGAHIIPNKINHEGVGWKPFTYFLPNDRTILL